MCLLCLFFFFFNDTATTEIYTLSLHDALPISFPVLEEIRLLTNLETSTEKLLQIVLSGQPELEEKLNLPQLRQLRQRDRKSTRLNSSHSQISYAVFCLKKKKELWSYDCKLTTR